MPSENKLSIVGIGPGSPRLRTAAATRAIRSADFVVGYRPYLDLISDLLPGKQVFSSSMGKEVDRVAAAVDLLEKGSVALVSSGDPNVYGMAGLGLELAERALGRRDCARSHIFYRRLLPSRPRFPGMRGRDQPQRSAHTLAADRRPPASGCRRQPCPWLSTIPRARGAIGSFCALWTFAGPEMSWWQKTSVARRRDLLHELAKAD